MSAGPKLQALTGLRVLLTLWVVVFHTLFFSVTFTEKADWYPWYYQPAMTFLRNGLTAVDVFFLLTGFLLSYGLFRKAALASAKPEDKTVTTQSISWRSFVWRRVSRVYPSYAACMLLIVFGIYRVTSICSMELVPESHVGIKALLNQTRASEDEVVTEYPTSLQLAPVNLLFLNNYLPFGGFMGWTWSLAIQGQFYLFFPLLAKWFGLGRRLVWVIAAGVLACWGLRFALWFGVMQQFLPIFIYLWDPAHTQMYFMSFNVWYSSSLQRMPVIFVGVLLAYFCAHHGERAAQRLRSSAALRFLGLAYCVAAIVLNHDDQFGEPVTEGFRLHLYYLLFFVGGPGILLAFCYMLFALIFGVGSISRGFQRLLSAPGWNGLADATFGVYLLHPAIILRMYSLYPHYMPGGIQLNWTAYAGFCAVALATSFGLGWLVYRLVELPIKNWMRGPAATSSASGAVVSDKAQTSKPKAKAKTTRSRASSRSRSRPPRKAVHQD